MIEFILVTATLTALNIFMVSSTIEVTPTESEAIRTIAETPSLLGALTGNQPVPANK
ncbi:MAG: hypothetical protein KUG73_00740 [Pseudomonadales bacterium]|nr:hypothetical protein [Pseudomonadales bacterium]